MRPLPESLAIGYANWGECDGMISSAATAGVNVIIWFALQLILDSSGVPSITGGPNLTCVGNLAASLEADGLSTHHLISIGGWNGAHPDPAASAEAWWSALKEYDEAAQQEGLTDGFDGIDWDLEGNDTPEAKRNFFTSDSLGLVARISELAKADGKLVTMSPAQSYLDVATDEFALDLIEPAACFHHDFDYHGRNLYAALLVLAQPDTFDLVTLQLYESWSQANCMLSPPEQGGHGMPLGEYLSGLIQQMDAGWQVNFELEPSLGLSNQTVRVPANKLLIGLANGWTGQGGCVAEPCKALYLEKDALTAAWSQLAMPARGISFWDIADEGASTGVDDKPLYLAEVLNTILHTRPPLPIHMTLMRSRGDRVQA